MWVNAIKQKAALAWVAQFVKSFKEETKVFIQMAHGKQATGQSVNLNLCFCLGQKSVQETGRCVCCVSLRP